MHFYCLANTSWPLSNHRPRPCPLQATRALRAVRRLSRNWRHLDGEILPFLNAPNQYVYLHTTSHLLAGLRRLRLPSRETAWESASSHSSRPPPLQTPSPSPSATAEPSGQAGRLSRKTRLTANPPRPHVCDVYAGEKQLGPGSRVQSGANVYSYCFAFRDARAHDVLPYVTALVHTSLARDLVHVHLGICLPAVATGPASYNPS